MRRGFTSLKSYKVPANPPKQARLSTPQLPSVRRLALMREGLGVCLPHHFGLSTAIKFMLSPFGVSFQSFRFMFQNLKDG